MKLAFFFLAAPLLAEPHLLLNRAGIEHMRHTAQAEKWAKKVVDGVIARAEAWPADHVEEFGLKEWGLPKEGAGWSHSYVCPDHGVRLKQSAGKNLCPIDGRDYHGWPVDNVVYMMRHGDNARALRDLGLAWQLTGNAAYAEKARRMLSAYAAVYQTWPIHDNYNKLDTKSGARAMSQTLSEAGWITPLVFGYDLIRDAVPLAEQRLFEDNVLREAARVIARYNAGKSNWQSAHNGALLAIGLVVKDEALVKLALDGPGGFKFQMRESITPDGPWFEGSWGYHFFALHPLLLTREMAVRAGIALPEAAALKKMLDAPLDCVFPDGTLPNFNDAGLGAIGHDAQYYEIGYRVFGDPRYLSVLKQHERGLESLLWGAPSLDAAKPVELTSGLLPDAGVATLRVKGSDHTLAIKFGPHGGGHGHYDKLTFVSFANGKHLAADPGTQAYAAPTHSTWDKMSIAHNTITVDEKTQGESTGKLLEWKAGPEVTAIRLAAGPAYPGIEIVRTIVHTAGYTLDVMEARATDGKPHRFDWAYHNYGSVTQSIATAPYTGFPKNSGYQHLTAARAADTSAAWQADFTQTDANLRVRMLGENGTTVVFGNGLGPDLRVAVPFAIARRTGTSATFVALYEPYAKTPRVTGFRARDAHSYVVETAAGSEIVNVTPGALGITRGIQ